MKSQVTIIGSGIAGSSLALTLARNGVSVTLLDKNEHPRFVLGESTLPPTSFWMKLMAERWGVPELHHVSSAVEVHRNVGSSSGVKKNFGFVHHKEGIRTPQKSWLVNIPAYYASNTGESHFFRQDIDAYLYRAAISAGAVAVTGVQISDVDIRNDGASIRCSDGRVFDTEYIVDASGHQSVVSNKLGLRENPTRQRTHSRCVFTHMVDVKPYDDCYEGPRPSSPWHSGTLHHIFDGGWIWVIPFDNHTRSTNGLCSVGLNIDLKKHPKDPTITAEQEWEQFVARFPSFAGQFAKAKSVRSWISTGRLQYSNHTTVGNRYCITAHANGAVDALFSRGMLNTFQSINTLVRLLLSATCDGDYSKERFAVLERLEQNLLDVHDSLVYGSYVAFCDPQLFDAWITVWSASEYLSKRHVLDPFRRFSETSDSSALKFDDDAADKCMLHYDLYRPLLDRCVAIMEQVERRDLDASTARECLFSELDAVAPHIEFDHRIKRAEIGTAAFSRKTALFQRYQAMALDVLGRFPGSERGLRRFGIGHYDQIDQLNLPGIRKVFRG